MSDIWNFREVRRYARGFRSDALDHIRNYLQYQRYAVKSVAGSCIKAEQQGIHVNFKPEINVVLTPDTNGQGYSVSIHFYAKVKYGSGIAFGVLTGGLSTIVGVGTFASHIADAKSFVKAFWDSLDAIAVESSSVISREGFDTPNTQQPPPTQQNSPYGQPPPTQQSSPYGQPPPQGYQQPYQQPGYPPQQQPSYQQGPDGRPMDDLKSLSNEDLEKRLQYHKETAWKIESELQMRRMASQQPPQYQNNQPPQYAVPQYPNTSYPQQNNQYHQNMPYQPGPYEQQHHQNQQQQNQERPQQQQQQQQGPPHSQ